MKKLLFAAVGVLCFVAAMAEAQPPAPQDAAQAPPAQPQGRKKRLAIFDFDYATVRSYSTAIFGSDIDIGKGVTDLLVRFLVENGTYSIIERKALDKILAEQNFSNSDRANPTSAAKLGRILGVDAIIVGSVTQFGNETQNQNIGGAGGGLGRFGLGGYSHKKSKAIVTLDARIVDIDTAEILGVASGHGESSRESTSLTGGGGGWGEPQARDPDAVARDVFDDLCTVANAAASYGVVIDPATSKVDPAATAKLRAAMRREARR